MSERIVDACTLINLYGSNRPLDILKSVGGMQVTPQVRRESLGIRAKDPNKPGELRHEKIDLAEAIDQGLLAVCELSSEEFELMVAFACDLDDGEASSLAVAKSRRWKLATDDKKARRIANENGVTVVSTSELLYLWAEKEGVADVKVTAALAAISRFARFSPPGDDPMSEWWNCHCS